MDDALAKKVPVYAKYLEPRRPRWLQAEKGYLAGVVVNAMPYDQKEFELKDFNNRVWRITNDDPTSKHIIHVFDGNKVKLIGVRIKHMEFKADKIMPFAKEPLFRMMRFQMVK